MGVAFTGHHHRLLLPAALAALASCGGPTAPTTADYLLAAESAHFRYFHASGDSVNADWEEAYYVWATSQLGTTLPQKIAYYKYLSRQDMCDRTGQCNANGFAVPERFEIHTLWPTDNHEVVHLYTSQFGSPSGFFNEGIAVAFQVDPVAGDFVTRFNGMPVHDACRQYLRNGTLILPLDRIVQGRRFSEAFGADELDYREAGSFVRFTIDRYGLDRMLQFFRTSAQLEPLAALKAHFALAIGVALEQVEQEWITFLSS